MFIAYGERKRRGVRPENGRLEEEHFRVRRIVLKSVRGGGKLVEHAAGDGALGGRVIEQFCGRHRDFLLLFEAACAAVDDVVWRGGHCGGEQSVRGVRQHGGVAVAGGHWQLVRGMQGVRDGEWARHLRRWGAEEARQLCGRRRGIGLLGRRREWWRVVRILGARRLFAKTLRHVE